MFLSVYRLFPIREEATDLVNAQKTVGSNVLFLNCQKFQSRNNLRTMKHFEQSNTASTQSSNIITLRDTMHYAPCDIPTVLMGSWARLPFSILFRFNTTPHNEDEQSLSAAPLPAWKSLGVCSEIGEKYLSDDDSQLGQCIEEHSRYLIYGTDYLQWDTCKVCSSAIVSYSMY